MSRTGQPPAASDRRLAVRRITIVGLACNLGLAGLKLAAGIVGSSAAVVADAVHSLSDTVTDVAILVGVRYWYRPPDRDHPYGHGRIETLVTALIGLVLAAAALGLAYDAARDLARGSLRTPGPVALAAALVSIAVKEALYRATRATGRRVRSPALEANAWHHRTDALSSLPAALAVGAALIDPSLSFLDSIGAIAVAALVLIAAWKITAPALRQLADQGADPGVRAEIERLAFDHPEVREVHRVRTRLAGSSLLVDLHVLVDGELSVRQGHNIAAAVRARLLEDGPGVVDVVVHVEPFDEHNSQG
ncbi:MAG: cation diffusion facilitator family transporter [Polyangia bacterium]